MGSLVWKVLGTGAAVLAASLAEKGITTAWRAATGEEPPVNPEDPDTHWGEAISWAVLSGAAIGVARLVATRRAAAYYRESSGSLPKGLAVKG
ncbi:MAG: DUF4235 domain-containing protein [Kineosporiaceae bacterium]|nr:DUF4235 domain-containing protein [Kineosporiaceae bacterium]MBK7622206.1 DUF4235 domain-containing protein [Kineosporiaceae bacterium]MBK8074534.1 DUF4235 domain-containing protein [Kineosporiaceae bacterium]